MLVVLRSLRVQHFRVLGKSARLSICQPQRNLNLNADNMRPT